MLSGIMTALGDNYQERQEKQKLIDQKLAPLKDLLKGSIRPRLPDLDKTSADTLE